MNREVWLMRHGALPPNPEHRFVGQREIPLSELGRRQALSWRQRLMNIPFAAVVCSDLSRCVETARLVTEGRDISLLVEPAFREISLGMWEGLTPDEVRKCFPGAYERRGSDMVHFRPQGGEAFADLAERAVPAFNEWAWRYAGQDLLIVAHAGVNRVLIARSMALPLQHAPDIPQPYACCASIAGIGME